MTHPHDGPVDTARTLWVFAERRRIARLAQRSPADSTRNANAGI
jgi:hypothetical protein